MSNRRETRRGDLAVIYRSSGDRDRGYPVRGPKDLAYVFLVTSRRAFPLRDEPAARLLLDKGRGVARNIVDAIAAQRVVQGLPQIFRSLITEAQRAAYRELVVERVELVLLEMGHPIEPGKGMAAAQMVLAGTSL